MTHEIPSRWRSALREHVRATAGEDRDHLLAFDFHPARGVRLGFPDGSSAFFRYAFHLRDEQAREVAVFTEHCGYHVFPAAGLEVEVVETVRTEGDDDEDASPA